jgi:hypothetical protein
MPKFRDLGINAIPATMRPPEVGAGGYGNQGGGGGGGSETQCIQALTCVPEMTVCQGQVTCAPETTECRGQITCIPPDYEHNPTECVTAFTCLGGKKDKEYDKDKEKDDDKRSTAGFAPETIAQLRNQLEGHIDNAEI